MSEPKAGLGSDRESHSDFQLIAGTNRDLFAAVRDGRFREDLLARINLWTFSLPGLRARPEDRRTLIHLQRDLIDSEWRPEGE